MYTYKEKHPLIAFYIYLGFLSVWWWGYTLQPVCAIFSFYHVGFRG